jgi:hypothetical protein
MNGMTGRAGAPADGATGRAGIGGATCDGDGATRGAAGGVATAAADCRTASGALPKLGARGAGIATGDPVEGAAGRAATAAAPAPFGAREKSLRASAPAAIVSTPPHTEQRARTLVPGIFPGSTRKTDRHSGQVTFMTSPPPAPPRRDR